MLLTAAIRDAAKEEDNSSDLVDKLETILYHDSEAYEAYKTQKKKNQLVEGKDVPFCRLVPSYSDRKAFFACILEGTVEVTDDDEKVVPFQTLAKRYFDAQIRARLEGRAERLGELRELATLALEKMGLTMVEVVNEINLPQVLESS